MRLRASRQAFNCISAPPKWVVLLVCFFSLTSGNATFKSAFGLNSAESMETYDVESAELHEKMVVKMPLELEGFATEKVDPALNEKKDNQTNPVQVLPETENAFASKNIPEMGGLPAVQTISAKMPDEKIEKYVRYGKQSIINLGVTTSS